MPSRRHQTLGTGGEKTQECGRCQGYSEGNLMVLHSCMRTLPPGSPVPSSRLLIDRAWQAHARGMFCGDGEIVF